MRSFILLLFIALLATAFLACNSNETLLTQNPQPRNPTAPATPPPDNARRITAEELHKLWEKNEVVIIDTRAEAAYKQEHIKGSLSVPAGTLNQKFDQLPRGNMIAAYCT